MVRVERTPGEPSTNSVTGHNRPAVSEGRFSRLRPASHGLLLAASGPSSGPLPISDSELALDLCKPFK